MKICLLPLSSCCEAWFLTACPCPRHWGPLPQRMKSKCHMAALWDEVCLSSASPLHCFSSDTVILGVCAIWVLSSTCAVKVAASAFYGQWPWLWAGCCWWGWVGSSHHVHILQGAVWLGPQSGSWRSAWAESIHESTSEAAALSFNGNSVSIVWFTGQGSPEPWRKGFRPSSGAGHNSWYVGGTQKMFVKRCTGSCMSTSDHLHWCHSGLSHYCLQSRVLT